MKAKWIRTVGAIVAATVLLAAGCGSEEDGGAESAADTSADRPTIVVTTNILGDVVEQLVGDHYTVTTVMPTGADPHSFQPSAQQVAAIGEADALIVNGADFEEGLLDVIEAAEGDGVPVFEAISGVDTVEFADGDHDHEDEHDHEDDEHADEDHDHEDDEHADEDHDHEDDEHADEDHDHEDEHADEDHDHEDEHADEEHDHHHEGVDPHFFTDPARMGIAADGIVEFLASMLDADAADALRQTAADYLAELEELDAEVEEILAAVPAERRVLVTNHEVFGYFADRYDFEIAGTVIPTGSTSDGANAADLAELAEVIEAEGVPAIFADTSSSDELAETLAAEVGGIEVVELFSESLGEADSDGATYVEMIRTNAMRIADALSE